MAVFDFLFGGTPPPSVTSQTTTTPGLPDWYQDQLRALIGRGSQIADQPYQTYGQPRIAGFNPNEQRGFDITSQGVGGYQPWLQQGAAKTSGVGGALNQDAFNSYMNPYISGVTDRIAQLGARNLSENLMPAVGDQFIGAGQHGSTRHQEFANRALRDTQEAVLGQQAQSLAQGYGQALAGYQTGQGQQLQAGQQLAGLGQLGQQLNLTDAAAMSTVGQQQRGMTQSNLDLAYQDFLRQQQYPADQSQYLSGIVRGLPAPQQATTQTQTGPGNFGPSVAQQLGGLGLAGFGLYSQLNRQPQRRGGLVRKRYARGGLVHASQLMRSMARRPMGRMAYA